MGKFPVFFLLLALSALAASAFGAAHNQLSFSVGPDYFLSLKFPQFGIADDTAPRLGAAIVGVQASWWMGVMVGLPAFLYGLLSVPTARSYFAAGLGAIGLVFLLSMAAAFNGLILGLVATSTGFLDNAIAIPDPVDRADFLRAGLMHEASYLGGGLGALLAFWPMIRAKRRDTEISAGAGA